ncbi:MAG TPA: TraR/DksA C4-type zinc finger protein [Anaeromyxobacter sp.]|nr:TraR/DksA C4-type zinc finger protein [Anaeromyxobacter sp.]
MTPQERLAHRRTLERLRAELLRVGAEKIEPNRRDPATTGVADEDAQALSEMLQVLASKRNEGRAVLLRQVDRALAKLADAPEDFGLCETCEEEIAPRRLALVPYATLCLECQARRDPKLGGSRKKLTDFR